MTNRMMMKTSSLAIALALSLAACGQPDDSRAQDGVFADSRVLPEDALSMKASFAPVVRETAPAVVNIAARGVQQYRDPFWGIPGQRQTGSVGSGVIVGRVQRGSYASRAGLQGGDIVLSVNGRAVTSVQQLADVGRGSEVVIERRGRRISGVIR